MLYANDYVILQESEDPLQHLTYSMHHSWPTICTCLWITQSVYIFIDTTSVWSKIVVDNTVLTQIFYFHYLGCHIVYDFDEDDEQKLNSFQAISEQLEARLVGKRVG